MKQFNSAFLYKNRNFLYTEEGELYQTPELKKFKSKRKHQASFKKSNSHSSRRSFSNVGYVDRTEMLRSKDQASFNLH